MSTTNNPKRKTPTEASNSETNPSDSEAQVAVLEEVQVAVLEEVQVTVLEEAQVAVLEECRRKIHLQLKLKKLQEKKALGFSTSTNAPPKEVAGLTKNKQLALECAKRIHMPDLYKSKSQKHLDQFLIQVNDVFKAQPTIYASDEDKCRFAGSLYNGIPRTN